MLGGTSEMTKQTKQRGFTIVELLIVIVIIAILASITIVAYNGITNRANAATAKANAVQVDKVVEAYTTETASTGYPTLAQLNAYSGTTHVPSGITLTAAALV